MIISLTCSGMRTKQKMIDLLIRKSNAVFPRANYLQKEFEECPFCGSRSIESLGKLHQSPDITIHTDFISIIGTVLSGGMEPDIKICTCRNCHIGFFNPQPTEEFLKKFYTCFEVGDHKKARINPRRLASHIKRHSGNLFPGETYRILDFGGGEGSVSQCIGQLLISSGIAKKVNISVVDLQSFTHKSEKFIFQDSYESLDQIPQDDKFDIVIASAILEHVKDPKQIILSLLQRMNKGGIFYARTPYTFPFYNMFKKLGLSFGMNYPAHLFDMGSYFWSDLLTTLNKSDSYRMKRSHTSLVHTEFRKHPIVNIVSHMVKWPSSLIGKWYPLSGGWEVVIERKTSPPAPSPKREGS